jgi:outer membrane protein assembly factor BamB
MSARSPLFACIVLTPLVCATGCASRLLPTEPFDGSGPGADLGATSRADASAGETDLAMPSDASRPPDLTPPPDFSRPPGSPTQAPSFRIDPAHTGAQEHESLNPPLTLAWSYDAGDVVSYPIVADGRVFITTATGLTTALDTSSGDVLWGPETLGRGLLHAYDSGRLYGLTSSGLLIALDAASGAHLWTILMPYQLDFFSPPVAANGLVYVDGLESGGDTMAIDGATGALVWDQHTFDGSDGCVAVSDDFVFEAESCLQVTAWTAASGTQRWHHSTTCTGGGGAAPAVYRGRVYVRENALSNTIFDAASGAVVGTFPGTLPAAFANGVGYYLQTATLVAIPVDGTAASWTFNGDYGLASAPVADGAYVYIGSSLGALFAVDGTGQAVWTTTLPHAVNAKAESNSMAIAEGTLLVPAGNILYAFR